MPRPKATKKKKNDKIEEPQETWTLHDTYLPGVSCNRVVTRSQTGFCRIKNDISDLRLFSDSDRHHPPGQPHLMEVIKGQYGGIPRTIVTKSTGEFLSVNKDLCQKLQVYKDYKPEVVNVPPKSVKSPNSKKAMIEGEASPTSPKADSLNAPKAFSPTSDSPIIPPPAQKTASSLAEIGNFIGSLFSSSDKQYTQKATALSNPQDTSQAKEITKQEEADMANFIERSLESEENLAGKTAPLNDSDDKPKVKEEP